MGFSNDQEPIPVKICCGEEIRRLTLPSFLYAPLCETITSLFKLDPQAPLVISYLDDEGDKISMSSDIELLEAIRIYLKANNSIFRFFVRVGTANNDNSQCQSRTSLAEVTYPFFHQYTVPHNTSGIFSSILECTDPSFYVAENGDPFCNFHAVHRETLGTFSPATEVANYRDTDAFCDAEVHHETSETFSPATKVEVANETQFSFMSDNVNYTAPCDALGSFSLADLGSRNKDEARKAHKEHKRAKKELHKALKHKMRSEVKSAKKELKAASKGSPRHEKKTLGIMEEID